MGFWDFFNPNSIISSSSGNVANAVALATLTPGATQRAYASGFEVTATGARDQFIVVVTLTGLTGGPLSFIFAAPGDPMAIAQPLQVTFPTPLQGAVPGGAVALTVPALGVENTNTAAALHGFIF
jgi:hypothetical protein